ncbi:Fanconi anemia group E protein [Rhinatrema bivittatum]|uniref:Fanconi anemia group E protein n=1 Tax=Rhinatrema bivittatum TaxID=194408 RepID=UPI0011265C5A|nr:Fanconi anemia group E protein [Rhinatrema bivittatum]XP_029429554.1 Fanconi anemia group E protein [Rhinatrema bivittatum]
MEEQGALPLGHFDQASRLLLQTLMSGPWGSLAAMRSLQRIQAWQEPEKRPFCWRSFTETLCEKEPILEGPEKTLILKPLLLLLPLVCQRNLLSLLHVAQSVVPRECLSKVLQAISQEASYDPWIVAHRDLLKRDLGDGSCSAPLPVTNTCQQQLKNLCQKLTTADVGRVDSKRQLSWFKDKFPESDPECAPISMSQNARKRKMSAVESHNFTICDSEMDRPRKRNRSMGNGMDFEPFSGHASQTGVTAAEKDRNFVNDVLALQTTQDQKIDARQSNSQSERAPEVPKFIKLCVPRLKELLQTEADISDVVAPPELQVLNDCDPAQLMTLCSALQFSELSEQAVLHFCTRIQALAPDLSFHNARILTTSLFLHRVLSLTESASRLLIGALTLFCSKYAGPVCCALINPILQAPKRGAMQVELVCRMVEECLEPEHLLLVFRQVVEVHWSEELLSVLHTLLGKKVELTPDPFDFLIMRLCQQASEFAKSIKYAKLMLTVVTKYQSSITSAHWGALAGALALNDTFLKKSLQAALKRLSIS